MNYILVHRGSSREQHKYIQKIKLADGSYRYFYTQAELDAYLKKNKMSIDKEGRVIYSKDKVDITSDSTKDQRYRTTTRDAYNVTTGTRDSRRVINTDRLIGRTYEQEYVTGEGVKKVTTREYGKLDRAAMKVADVADNVIDAGKDFIKKLFE